MLVNYDDERLFAIEHAKKLMDKKMLMLVLVSMQ